MDPDEKTRDTFGLGIEPGHVLGQETHKYVMSDTACLQLSKYYPERKKSCTCDPISNAQTEKDQCPIRYLCQGLIPIE